MEVNGPASSREIENRKLALLSEIQAGQWYQRPFGIILISILAAVIVNLLNILAHRFGLL